MAVSSQLFLLDERVGWNLDARFDCGLNYVACGRDLIDWAVHRRVTELTNVAVREEVDVTGWQDGRPLSDSGGI